MNISWNEEKNNKLKQQRDVSFDELICDGDIIDVIDNPAYKNQEKLIISYKGYVYAVPYIVDGNGIFLKTLYPSRELYNTYKARSKNENV